MATGLAPTQGLEAVFVCSIILSQQLEVGRFWIKI